MRVYITDLEAHERGFFVGGWLEFPMSVDELNEAIKDELLKFKFLVYQGYSEKDIIESALDSYKVEIYDFRGENNLLEVLLNCWLCSLLKRDCLERLLRV